MAVVNGLATLADFKLWIRTGGVDIGTDATDDLVVEDILEAVSVYIEGETSRWFNPRVETRCFNVPSGTINDRVLWLDKDLLEIITLTNGDDNTIASTKYNLYPINEYPKYSIRLKELEDTYWEPDSESNTEGVIDVLSFWGHHNEYTNRAWPTGSTINEGAEFSTADATLTVTSGSLFVADQIIKIENELLRITAVATHDLTVVRGENGSTAAAHADGSTVYIWTPQYDIRQACLMIANAYYKRRYGESTSSVATVTAAGVVITPQDIPSVAAKTIERYRSWV